ncbi:MAG: hypothetical protein NTW28_18945 [Candidatus Solibacter sp.]|nr:hypothetical protein [Candidatus Solibacter sp.]
MNRTFSILALALLVCAAASAATINTTVTMNATAAANATFTAFTVAGTANFTGGIGNGTIASSISLASLTGTTAVADYTITLASGGTLTGKLSVPVDVLTGGATPSASVSMTVTGGTGTYVAATSGTTPITLTGSVTGDLFTGFKLNNFTGSGTITTGGTPPVAGPTITEVLDAGSYTKNIAQGSIFVVKGTTLSASGFTQFAFPLPASSSGVKITFTPAAGGSGTDAYLVYLYNQGGVNQLAAVLPSSVAPGNYNVTVTNGTTSAPFAVQVLQRKLGLITADSSGSGLAVIQNYISAAQLDIDRFTTFASGGFTFSPSRPGQILIAWATGMGPVTGGDNTASPGFDFNASGVTVRVLVGGVSITPLYAGRAPGLAGADQINFQLPSNIPTGCTVSFQVSVNGVLSNPSFIAIAPDNSATACVAPGYTTQQLRNFDNGGSFTTGNFSITQFAMSVPSAGTQKINAISGSFSKITGFQLASASEGNISVIQSGSCQVIQSTTSGGASGGGSVTNLDAGTVTINGPAGSSLTNQALTKTSNAYSLTNIEGFSFPGQTAFSLPAGTYTVNGAGGNDVGTFNTSITLGSLLTLANPLPATVVRSAGLTLNWTGGNASDLVEIIGSSSTSTGTGSSTVTNSTTFICLTTAGQRTFTVPASVLTQLPATTTAGSLIVASGVTPATFTASLKAGGSIDSGSFSSFVGIGGAPAYQ